MRDDDAELRCCCSGRRAGARALPVRARRSRPTGSASSPRTSAPTRCENELAVWRVTRDGVQREARVEARRGAGPTPASSGRTRTRSSSSTRRRASAPARTLERKLGDAGLGQTRDAVTRRARTTTRRGTARSAASCCGRAACRRRSSARSTTLLPRFGAALTRRRRSTSPRCSAARRRVVLEIGFGMGETTAAIAPRTRSATSSASRCTRRAWARCSSASTALGPHQRARDPPRRGRGGRAHDSRRARSRASTSSSPIRGRRSATTSGGCCRRRFVHALALRLVARRLPARGDRLGGLRAGDARDAVGRAAAREHRRRLRAATGVAPADQVRAARPRARPRRVRPRLPPRAD